jgi:hypothetical protein
VDPAHLINELRQHMAHLRPVPAARHTSPSTFVHSDLESCTHVFVRQNTTRRALELPYSGPYRVLSRRVKTATSRVREACQCQRTGSSRPRPSTGPTTRTTSTRQSQHPRQQHHQPRRHSPAQELHAPAVTFISRSLQYLRRHYRVGVMWEPPTIQNRQLPPCSKRRRHLYPTEWSLAVKHLHRRYPTCGNS